MAKERRCQNPRGAVLVHSHHQRQLEPEAVRAVLRVEDEHLPVAIPQLPRALIIPGPRACPSRVFAEASGGKRAVFFNSGR